MTRKSKGKFEMKGHSIPGIKGFKSTALEDGRAASSAFQMQSPVKQDVIKEQLEGEDEVMPPMPKPRVEDPSMMPPNRKPKGIVEDPRMERPSRPREPMMGERLMDPDKFGGMNPREMMQMPTETEGEFVYVDDDGNKYNEDGTPYRKRPKMFER
tara:strand:- start:4 stop:468 length:465 start_codon:yes stop_codon:yes gene_type:complete